MSPRTPPRTPPRTHPWTHPWTPEHLSPKGKMRPIYLVCPNHQPIELSSMDYLAMFIHFRSHTRILGSRSLSDFASIFSQITAQSCTEKRGNLKWKDSKADLTFYRNYECYNFWKHNCATIDGLKSDSRSGVLGTHLDCKWGSLNPSSDNKPNSNCVRFESDQT